MSISGKIDGRDAGEHIGRPLHIPEAVYEAASACLRMGPNDAPGTLRPDEREAIDAAILEWEKRRAEQADSKEQGLLVALRESQQRAERAEAERDEARKNYRIIELSLPIEEDLHNDINEMCRHLLTQQGFTLDGIGTLLERCQKRMAADWVEIGNLRSECAKLRARAAVDAAGKEKDDAKG